MKAMGLDKPGAPLHQVELPDPSPGPGQVLVRVAACGVCRTDLHVVDGDLRPAPAQGADRALDVAVVFEQ